MPLKIVPVVDFLVQRVIFVLEHTSLEQELRHVKNSLQNNGFNSQL